MFASVTKKRRAVVGALATLFAAASGIVVTAATLEAPVAVWAPLAGLWLLGPAAVVVLAVLEQRNRAAAERAPIDAGRAGHFEPKSRGAELGEPGWYFTGRERAIRERGHSREASRSAEQVDARTSRL